MPKYEGFKLSKLSRCFRYSFRRNAVSLHVFYSTRGTNDRSRYSKASPANLIKRRKLACCRFRGHRDRVF